MKIWNFLYDSEPGGQVAPRSRTGLTRGPALFLQVESWRVEAWLPGLLQVHSCVGGAQSCLGLAHTEPLSPSSPVRSESGWGGL